MVSQAPSKCSRVGLAGGFGARVNEHGSRRRTCPPERGCRTSRGAHDVTRWQVYDWCKKLTTGGLALAGEATREPLFAALVVEPPASSASRARHISSEKAKPLPVELVVDGAILRALRYRRGVPDRNDPRDPGRVAMISPTGQLRVHIAMRPIDFRKGIDGLALAVKETPGLDPLVARPSCSAPRARTGSIRVLQPG